MALIYAVLGTGAGAVCAYSQPAVAATHTNGLLSTAVANLAKYRAKPAFVPPGPPLDVATQRGKSVLVVAHDLISDYLVGVAKGIQQAGRVAGVKVAIFNGRGTVSTIEQGIAQGIRQHVSAIVLNGVAADLVPASLRAAAKAGIPVVGTVIGEPRPGVVGQGSGSKYVFGLAGPSYEEFGRLIAYTAIDHAHGKPVHAVVETFNNPVATAAIAGIKEVFAKCPDCRIVSTQNVEPREWPKVLPSLTVSMIRSHLHVNYIFTSVDTMGIFATAGVKESGATRRVHVISGDGAGPGPLALVQHGHVFLADPGASATWIGWEAMDQVLRAMSGAKPGNPVVPLRYLDARNLRGVNVKQRDAIYGGGFRAGYERLWGISK